MVAVGPRVAAPDQSRIDEHLASSSREGAAPAGMAHAGVDADDVDDVNVDTDDAMRAEVVDTLVNVSDVAEERVDVAEELADFAKELADFAEERTDFAERFGVLESEVLARSANGEVRNDSLAVGGRGEDEPMDGVDAATRGAREGHLGSAAPRASSRSARPRQRLPRRR